MGQYYFGTTSIKAGANVNTQDNNGHTPLHWAAFKSHKEVIQLILGNGYTPLHNAVRNDHYAVSNLLILTLDNQGRWQEFANQHSDLIKEIRRTYYSTIVSRWNNAFMNALQTTRAMTQDQTPIVDISLHIADKAAPEFNAHVAQLLGFRRRGQRQQSSELQPPTKRQKIQ